VLVVHVAVAFKLTADHVTVLVLQPVFELQLTVPVTSFDFTRPLRLLRPFTKLFSAAIVAVNVTGEPYVDGFTFDVTAVVVVAWLMVKLLLCELLDAV
jgi:hypothetical protein